MEPKKDVHDILAQCALAIARTRGYLILDGGLQPVEDYEIHGELQPGLQSKRRRKIAEAHEAAQARNRAQMRRKLLHILYYSVCVDAATGESGSPSYRDCLSLAEVYGFFREEIEAGAVALYQLRAGRPYRKDVESSLEREERLREEDAVIQAAVDTRPWPGFLIGELAVLHNLSPATLYSAVDDELIPFRRVGRNVLINTQDPRWKTWLMQHQAKQRRKAEEESEVSEQ